MRRILILVIVFALVLLFINRCVAIAAPTGGDCFEGTDYQDYHVQGEGHSGQDK